MTPFSEQNGLLTPTLKLKRQEAEKIYGGLCNAMYKKGPLDAIIQARL